MDQTLLPEKKINFKKIIIISTIIGVLFLVFIWNAFVPPFTVLNSKSDGATIEIKNGMGARQVAIILKESGVIRNESFYVGLISILGDENKIAQGTYLFKRPLNIFEAEKRIRNGDFGIVAKKITFPEGFTNIQIAERLKANLPKFDKNKFLNLASTSEGYLYPETYFFLPNDTEEIIFKKLTDTFKEKIKPLEGEFASSTKTEDEIITMASILEREVKSAEDKKIVSDILWSRIKVGMALQVDATLAYERDKDSYTLTTTDLRQDSPYNTYTRKGLPRTPISNPGFDAIVGALEPKENPYLYFLTDKDGKVYYAKTYAEHLKNKARHFNK